MTDIPQDRERSTSVRERNASDIEEPKMSKKVGAAALLGTTIEFYDFYIYGIAAALVFNKLFFTDLDPVVGTVASFGTFAVGFISRPLGSFFFGHFGDRIGRRKTLVASLLTMGVATILIGLLPSYTTLGVAAPILLTTLRFIQGFGLGGEWGGAALLVTEYAKDHNRGLYGSIVQLGSAPGFLLANGLYFVLSASLSDEAMYSWGWRVPFILSAVLIVVGLWIRISIDETPIFKKLSQSKGAQRAPGLEVLKKYWMIVLLGGTATAITYVLFFITGTYGLSYGVETLNIDRTVMLGITMSAVVAQAIFTVWGGHLSDKFGRNKVIIVGGVLAAIWSFAFFPMVNTGGVFAIALAFSVTLAIMGIIYGPMGAFQPELFPTRVRYTGAALSYSMGGIFGGGLAPIIAAELNSLFGYRAIGFYIAVMALLSIASVLILKSKIPNFDD